MLFRKIDKDSGGSVSGKPQPNCRTFFNIATAFLSPSFFGFLLGCPSTCLCANEHFPPNLQPDSYLEIVIREDANRHKVIWCKYLFQVVFARLSIELPRLASALTFLFPRRTSTSWCWWFRCWSGFWCRFCTLVSLMPETALSSQTLPFFAFPLPANSLSSFNAT